MTAQRQPEQITRNVGNVDRRPQKLPRIKTPPKGKADPVLARIDWNRAINIGYDMAIENCRSDTEIGDAQAMWELLREAAQVSAQVYKAPPRTGYPTKANMPDYIGEASDWSYMLAEFKAGGGAPNTRPTPSPEQIDRAEVVLYLWHRYAIADKGDWSRMRKAVMSKAIGVRDVKVRAVTGMSKQAIHRAKMDAMRDMLEPLRRWIG